MPKAIVDTRKSRGRPRIDATQIGLRLPPDNLAAVDAWIATQCEQNLSRPEAIRRLVEIGLAGATAGRPKKSAASPRPSKLAAAAIDKLVEETAPTAEQAARKRRLVKGPEEFRDVRADRRKK